MRRSFSALSPKRLLLHAAVLAGLSSCALFGPNGAPPRPTAGQRAIPARGKFALSTAPQRNPNLAPRPHSAPAGSPVSNLIATARSYLDSPYASGGTTSVGLDCSGFLCVCFRQVGVSLPRVSRQQAEAGEAVRFNDLRPGDLVFFATAAKTNPAAPINHVGLVTEVRPSGEVWFIHSSSSRGVREDNLLTPYWQAAYARARRVPLNGES